MTSTTDHALSAQRVLTFLTHEADLDGLVTTVQREIAQGTGLCAKTVHVVLHRLERDGAIRIEKAGTGRRTGGYTPSVIQLLGDNS